MQAGSQAAGYTTSQFSRVPNTKSPIKYERRTNMFLFFCAIFRHFELNSFEKCVNAPAIHGRCKFIMPSHFAFHFSFDCIAFGRWQSRSYPSFARWPLSCKCFQLNYAIPKLFLSHTHTHTSCGRCCRTIEFVRLSKSYTHFSCFNLI